MFNFTFTENSRNALVAHLNVNRETLEPLFSHFESSIAGKPITIDNNTLTHDDTVKHAVTELALFLYELSLSDMMINPLFSTYLMELNSKLTTHQDRSLVQNIALPIFESYELIHPAFTKRSSSTASASSSPRSGRQSLAEEACTIETTIKTMQEQNYTQWRSQLLRLQAEYIYKSNNAWKEKKKIHENKANFLKYLIDTFNIIRLEGKIPTEIDTLPLLIDVMQRCWIYDISFEQIKNVANVDIAVKNNQLFLNNQSVFQSKLNALSDGSFSKKLKDFANAKIPSCK